MLNLRTGAILGVAATLIYAAAMPAAAATVAAPAGVNLGMAQSNGVGWYRAPGSTVWSKANGTFAGAPVPVQVGSTVHLVAALTNGAMVHRTTNSAWTSLTTGAVPCSTPSAVASGTTIHVACGSAAGVVSVGSFSANAARPAMTLTALSGKVAAVSIAKGPNGPVYLGIGSWYQMTGAEGTWNANMWIRSAGDTVWSKFGLPCDGSAGISWSTSNLFVGCVTGPVVSTMVVPNDTSVDPSVYEINGKLVGRLSMASVGDGSRVEVFGTNTLSQPVAHTLGSSGPIGGFRALSGTGRNLAATSTADLTIQQQLAGTRAPLDLKAVHNVLGRHFANSAQSR